MHHGSQARRSARRSGGWGERRGAGADLIVPNPKLKLLDQVREVMRLKHYSIRTERCYCDWIRRYIKFHGMRSQREDLQGAEAKIEQFLSDLAVNGHVTASPQNQAPDPSGGFGGRLRCGLFARGVGPQIPDGGPGMGLAIRVSGAGPVPRPAVGGDPAASPRRGNHQQGH